ncbi:UNVERIFIED_CONTAM: hypothetical protein Slati_1907300 [Sesamum latifolium]|uniref:Integrase catalytic domain-containing protein n=1 Tax=Sesamum latifolium TaxID=2727402 RepID=A0AAW2X3C2_9LAMI
MKAPTCLNEAQRLTGRIAALSRFISKSAEKSLPFFKMLRKAKTFEWGTPCQLAFEELKAYLARLPLLVKPSPGETLRKNTPIEKMALALVVTARRLRPYFLSHPVGVKTNTPLKQTTGKPDTSGRLVKWAVELSEYDISYLPRTTNKAQALAYFVSEMVEMTIKDASQDQKWLLHVNGSSTAQGSGAEYEALVIGMRMAHETGAKHLLAYSEKDPLAVQPITTGEDWRTPIIKWIEEGLLPENRWEAARLKKRAIRFIMQEHILYKKSYTHPLLRCLSTKEGIHILQEIHSGCCGAHVGTRILANKALRAEYFWPTMKQDAIQIWGMDIVGPFLLAAGQRKFLLVAIDYFTKWVEAEPLARITEGEVMKFIWKNIVCRFGIPREIISDNGHQFQDRRIQEWCQGLHIRTTPRGSTGESPFSLVYGIEAIIPAELGIPSHRVMNFSEKCNENLLRENLDLIEKLRENAFLRMQRCKNIMISSYNKRVKPRGFQVGDLVL